MYSFNCHKTVVFYHGSGVCLGSCQVSPIPSLVSRPKDVNFVINVGDSFYPDGVSSKDDPQWEVKWRQVYSPEARAWFLSYLRVVSLSFSDGVHFGCTPWKSMKIHEHPLVINGRSAYSIPFSELQNLSLTGRLSGQVRGVPWYSIYGNHDYHADPCAAAQLHRWILWKGAVFLRRQGECPENKWTIFFLGVHAIQTLKHIHLPSSAIIQGLNHVKSVF